MSDESIQLLDDLGQRFGIAIDWSSENVIPYLKDLMSRYISYEMITSIVLLATFTICCIGMVIAIQHLIKYEKKYNESCNSYEEIMWPSVISIFCLILIIFCIAGIGDQINDIISCNTIPEKLIISYINTLM